MTAAAPAPTTRSAFQRRVVSALVFVAAVLLFLVSETVFAAPVLALVGTLGAWPGFIVSFVLYLVGSLALAWLAVRAYDGYSHGEPSRLARWLTKESESSASKFSARLVAGGTVVGFAVSTLLAGGVVTTWLLCYTGRRRHLRVLAVISCLVWSAFFTAAYSFLGSMAFSKIF